MKNTVNASQIYARFRSLPGSEYIATEHAIAGLVKWLRKKRPLNALEVGAGIGTLTFSCVAALQEIQNKNSGFEFQLVSVESNAFCLDALRQNLAEQWGSFKLVPGASAWADSELLFDFVLIDGGEQDPNYVKPIARRGIIFIEGYMWKKHELIAATHLNRPYIATNFRSRNRKASYWIYQFEPRWHEKLWFQVNNLYNRAWSSFRRVADTVNDPQQETNSR